MNPTYGNCYTFNFEDDNSKPAEKATLTGPANGLELELVIDQMWYMRNGLSQEAGAKVICM